MPKKKTGNRRKILKRRWLKRCNVHVTLSLTNYSWKEILKIDGEVRSDQNLHRHILEKDASEEEVRLYLLTTVLAKLDEIEAIHKKEEQLTAQATRIRKYRKKT